MTSEIMDIDDVVDSHIHKNLSGKEEINLIHPIPTKEDATKHIEGLKSYFTSIENVQDETFSLIYKIETAVNQHKYMFQTDLGDYLNKKIFFFRTRLLIFFSRSLQKRKNGVSLYIPFLQISQKYLLIPKCES
jgi:hypothetical protein